jgi:hypothetical protein
VSGSRVWREVKPKPDQPFAALSRGIQCAECDLVVDEFALIADHWRYFHDGTGELVPYCPACAVREFDPVAVSSR